ncbi:MAG TPA: hypothetical protein VHX61_05830 [Rhizomicrobium sp.]|jgi:hypothetical protein|nr:hypothetical protein [Rhizomicrobium sp.]
MIEAASAAAELSRRWISFHAIALAIGINIATLFCCLVLAAYILRLSVRLGRLARACRRSGLQREKLSGEADSHGRILEQVAADVGELSRRVVESGNDSLAAIRFTAASVRQEIENLLTEISSDDDDKGGIRLE